MKKILKLLSPLVFIIVLGTIIFIFPQEVKATYGDTTTFLGKIYDGDGKSAPEAYLDFPEDVKVDSSGNFYIADTYNNVIRKINSSGIISTLAGTGSYGLVNGASTSAEFALPRGVAVDSSGNVYVADSANNAVRKIDTHGLVSTLVSSGLNNPQGMVVHNTILYIADTDNNAIKMVPISGGNVSTLTTNVNKPKKLDVTSNGSYLYVADSGSYRVLKVNTSDGSIEVVAGSGEKDYQEGIGTAAKFNHIWGVTLVGNSLFVSDGDGFTDMIREINLTTNTTSLFASDTEMASINFPTGLTNYNNYIYVSNSGIGTIEKFNNISGDPLRSSSETFAGVERFGNRNGNLNQALLGRPYDLVMTSDRKYIYVADNNKIRKINLASNQISHVIGHSIDSYQEGNDIDLPNVRFSTIQGITVNSAETALYIVDRWNNRIRKIDLTTSPVSSSLLTGAGRVNTTGTQRNGYQEGIKCESIKDKNESFSLLSGCAYLDNPAGIVISPDNQYLYFTDTGNNRVRKVRISDGQTSLVAGSGETGYQEGTGASAKFNKPFGIAIDSQGQNLYIADTNNHRIRQINIATGSVSTVVGNGQVGYREAIGTDAVLSYPEYVGMGEDGNLYFTEVGSHRIRLVELPAKLTKLVAGSGERGFKNGLKEEAKFNNLKGMVINNVTNSLYVADSWDDAIRKVDITGGAPFSNPAPQVSSVSPKEISLGWAQGGVLQVQVMGSNFRYGATTLIGNYKADRTYVVSERELSVALPITQLKAGWWDVTVRNLDGQEATLERGLGIKDASGNVPATYYEYSDKTPPAITSQVEVASGKSFFAYDPNLRGGYYLASGNVLGDDNDEIITGTGLGLGPQVRIFDKEGVVKGSFFAYFSFLRSGVRMTTCNLVGDSYEEIITAPGPGGRPHIRIFKSDGTEALPGFFALDGEFKGGAYVACGDVNGDGRNEIVVTAGKGGGAQVTVHRADGTIIANFFAYDKNTFRNGIKVAVADINNDGREEIITGPEYGSPHIQIFEIRPNEIRRLTPGFYAFHPDYKGGVSVSGLDINGDSRKEIMIGVGQEATPLVRIFNQDGSVILKEFYAYALNFQGGVNVGGGDVDGDSVDEVLVIPREGGGPNVRIIEVGSL